MLRRQISRFGALVLGTVGLVAVAAPAHAATVCSLNSGHLTISVTDAQTSLTRVYAQADPTQLDALVVRVANPSPVTCVDGAEHAFRLDDLVDITLSNITGGGSFRLDVTTPFQKTGGSLVPVILHQYTIPGTQMGLDIMTLSNAAVQTWAAVPGAAPAIDLDNDASPDVTIDTSGGDHTDRISLITGDGNDVIDLTQDTLPGGWPTYTYLDTNFGADQVIGGPEQDWITPGYGADDVTASTYDQVTVFGDSETDHLASTSSVGTTLIYNDFENITLHPDDALPNDGTQFDLELNAGDYVSGFRTYQTGTGDDTFFEPNPVDPFSPDTPAIGFDGGSGYDTFDASALSFSIYVASFQNNDEVDVSFPNQSIGVLRGVNRLVATSYNDLIFTVDDNVTVVPGQGDDQVHAKGTGAILEADAVADGADTFSDDAHDGIWDYSARTSAVSVSLDHVNDDGAPGEGDTVDGDDVRSVLTGSGNDTVVGDLHANVITTGAGLDTVLARGGNDQVDGGDGDDLLVGGGGDDLLYGGAGNDRLNGSAGDDDEYGLDGNDTFQQGASSADNGSDLMVGGTGTDTATYLGRSSGVTLSNNGGWDDGLPGEYDRVGVDIEKLIGTNAADTITGGGLADWLYGYGGTDTLHGGGGNDLVDGGTAADKLFGDAGNDSLYAKDNTKDTVNGGTGTDKARRDAIDLLTSIEGTL